MTTFEEARQIVLENQDTDKFPPEADYYVETWGYENDEVFWLFARSPHLEFQYVEDGPRITVDKATGEYREDYGLDMEPLAAPVTEVGTGHPVEEPQEEPPYDPAFDVTFEG